MNVLPVELEDRLVHEESTRANAVAARHALENALYFQLRSVSNSLLADRVLRGSPVTSGVWWQYFLAEQEVPARFTPDIRLPAFTDYRGQFELAIASGQITPLGHEDLLNLELRVLGGFCPFADEGRINWQLEQLGSSMRFLLFGAHKHRRQRILSFFGQEVDAQHRDARFILGTIGPVSVFGGTTLFLFDRELAVSPWLPANASAFVDGSRIGIRQYSLRAEVEQVLERQLAHREKGNTEGSDRNSVERPFTEVHGVLQGATAELDDPAQHSEEILHLLTMSVLLHESADAFSKGARVSNSAHELVIWRQLIRLDLLRYAREPRTLSEFETVFSEFFGETKGNVFRGMGPAFIIPTPEDGYTVRKEVNNLYSCGLLRSDDGRYQTTIYGEGCEWTL